MTPAATARLMASMFEARGKTIRLLDAGAGVGSLTAAFVAEICARRRRPNAVELVAFEIDKELAARLAQTLQGCEDACRSARIGCTTDLRRGDFVEFGARMISGGFFSPQIEQFDCAILNPPYRKIHTESKERAFLRHIGVETSNLYTAFLSIVLKLLAPGGEI